MQILTIRLQDGSVSVQEAPAPLLVPGCVRVRTHYSAVSPGTEGGKVVAGKKSLLGKARARPEQVRAVIDMARTVGIRDTLRKVRAKLEGASPMGYSLAGEVIEVGEGVTTYRPGDRVACAGGYANHADEVVVPVNLVAPIPDGVPAEAAAMTTIGAIAMQGLRLAEPTLGENAVVIGLGVVGLLAGQLLRANGCRVFGADIAAPAIDLALRAGSVDVAGTMGEDPIEGMVDDFCGGQGADLVLICAATASDEPVALAGRIARKRGRVVVVGAVGMDIPRPDYYEKELSFSVSCSYGPGRYDPSYEEGGIDYPYGFVRWTEGRNMSAFLDLVAAGRIDPAALLTHRFPFADAPKAYDMVSNRSEPYAGILLEYPQEANEAGASPPFVTLTPQRKAVDGVIGIGCIGAGSYAQSFLLPHFKGSDKTRLTAIFTRTGLVAVDAGQRFGFERAVESAEAVIDDADTQAVVVATRHDQHGPLVVAALEKGMHVFVEKPLCLNEDELRAIASTAAALSAGGALPIVQTGFNRRFSSSALAVRKHFGAEPGPLTMFYRVNAGQIPAGHWIQDPKEGGGRILGEVCHFVDLMQFVAGADPVEVFAASVDAGDPAELPADNVCITMRFDNGSVGTIGYFARGGKAMPKERLEVFGAGRSAVLDNFGGVDLYSGNGKSHKRCAGKGQAEEVAVFLAAIAGGEPAISLRSQMATTLATIRALESLRTGAPAACRIEEFL